MKVTVMYFAQLKQQRGLDEESIETDAGTVAGLYRELRGRHNFTLEFKHIRAARNDAFCDPGTALSDGDRVAYMPPMAGG